MDKVEELDGLPKKDHKEEVIKDVGLDRKDEEEEEDIEEEEDDDLRFEIEEDEEDEDEDEKEDDDEDNVYKDLVLNPEVSKWVSTRKKGEIVHGVKVMDVPLSTDCKRYEFDLCPICVEPWSLDDKTHHLSALHCGHMFGMSCLKKWIKDRPSSKCPECYQDFSLENVTRLYAPRLCIPAAADQKASIRYYSFTKLGFTLFKEYEWDLRTDALKNRSDVLKRRADVLGRQNHAMNRRAELLNRMADLEKRADVLELQNDAMKRETQLLNRLSEEEEWAEASEQQADAEKRAEVFRRKASALGQRADEYLRKADAFGQQAKALRQEAKSLRQLVDSYLASRKFYIQSYREFLGLRDNKITE